MRRYDLIRGVTATGAFLLLASGGVLASPGTPAPENNLMGVSLMTNYREVLHKFGQPQEIQVSGGGGGGAPAGALGGMSGGPPAGPGGMRGMAPGMAGGEGGPPGGLPGFPGGPGGMSNPKSGMFGRPQGMGGPPNVGGMTPGMAGLPPGKGGMMPGAAGMGGGPPGGFPGGMRGMAPGMPGGGMSNPKSGMFGGGGGSGAGNVGSPQGAAQQETTWWYHFPQKGLHVSFLLNYQGRVIQIQEYGWHGGTRTRQGIGLGSTLGQLIQRYGWSNDGEHANVGGHEMVTMRYGGSHKIAFQLVDNKVVGITLGVVH